MPAAAAFAKPNLQDLRKAVRAHEQSYNRASAAESFAEKAHQQAAEELRICTENLKANPNYDPQELVDRVAAVQARKAELLVAREAREAAEGALRGAQQELDEAEEELVSSVAEPTASSPNIEADLRTLQRNLPPLAAGHVEAVFHLVKGLAALNASGALASNPNLQTASAQLGSAFQQLVGSLKEVLPRLSTDVGEGPSLGATDELALPDSIHFAPNGVSQNGRRRFKASRVPVTYRGARGDAWIDFYVD